MQFGKPICAHQAIRHKLVTARTRLEACRLMLYHAAWLAHEGRPCAIETSMAKLFIADTGVEIALACQQVMGAYALSDAYDMERNVRDLLGMPIVGGSSDMQKNNLAGAVEAAGLMPLFPYAGTDTADAGAGLTTAPTQLDPGGLAPCRGRPRACPVASGGRPRGSPLHRLFQLLDWRRNGESRRL